MSIYKSFASLPETMFLKYEQCKTPSVTNELELVGTKTAKNIN